MNGLHKASIFLAGLLVLAACGGPEPEPVAPSSPAPAASSNLPDGPPPAPVVASPTSGDMAAIRAAGASKDKAYGAGNAASMISFYEDDAVLMPPTASVAKGRASIRRFLEGQFDQLSGSGYVSAVDSAVEIRVSGNLGIRSGTYSTKDASGAIVDSGKWLEVWNKSVDGRWAVSRDISNSDTLPLTLGIPDEEEQTVE
jgi:ketosteroid isomerase-like protein